MVKVQSSTSEVVMNYYKKYNISLKYEETKNEQPFVSYTLSLFNGNNKIFTDHETQYFNNNAIEFIKQNKDIEYNVYDNLEGINIYLYYFQPVNKWFVSTKKQINNHEIYKSVIRAMNYEKLIFEQLDKNYVYVLKLISNKFIRFCSYSRFNKYDYIFFIKKINRQTNEIFYNDDQHIFARFNIDIDYKTKYKTIENFIETDMKNKNLNAFKENGYLKCIGLTVYCIKDNQRINLNIDTNVYKFISESGYDYQKYKLKPIDVLFFNYLLSHDENYKKRIIDILKIEYMPTILSVRLGQYEKIIDKVCVYMSTFYINKETSNYKSLEYFKSNFNKFIEGRKSFITEKDYPSYICEYFKVQNINIFFSILKSIKKSNHSIFEEN